MAPPRVLDIGELTVQVTAAPLSPSAFAAFGDVAENPRPDVHPSAFRPGLPLNAVSANQGSAIKYLDVSHLTNLYDQAPSRRPGRAVANMFVCAPRHLRPGGVFAVEILERHPFTTQMFVPLCRNSGAQYLVVVAPSLPAGPADEGLPVPSAAPTPLPGRGLPDLRRLRAFVATARQAVTYGPGTWHAPMVALGNVGSAIDFVVVQYANSEGIEDCQEVVFSHSSSTSSDPTLADGVTPVSVKIRTGERMAKL